MALLAAGCATAPTAPVMPPFGFIYSNLQSPLDDNFDNTDPGSKVGEASTVSILGFTVGDASAMAAARNGGIQSIRHADYKYFNVLSVYQSFTVVVYGE